MFSLIISIIAIALVGVLALATIWYGTDAYTDNKAKAGAAQIINETEQIEGAILAYNVEKGTSPTIKECAATDTDCEPLEDLITSNYLRAAPSTDSADAASKWAVAVIYDDGVAENEVSALVKTVVQEECILANEMMEFEGLNLGGGLVSGDATYDHLEPALVDGNPVANEDGEYMIPQCDAVMPSNVVCCQTVEAAG